MTITSVFVRDEFGNRTGEMQYSDLEYIPRFNAVGTWTLDTKTSVLAPGEGIVINRDGVDVMSGPVVTWHKSLTKKGYSYQYVGVDDMVYLTDRLAYPVVTGPPYTAAANDVRTGACETILKQYVNYNVGPGATSNRRVAGFTIEADAGAGAVVTGRARFNILLDFMANLALAGGDLGFRIINKVFQVYVSNDFRSSVIFSTELGNLAEYEYTFGRAAANYVICGGGGVGTARTILEGSYSDSIVTWGRVEKFKDLRNTTVTAEILQGISEDLLEGAETSSLRFLPMDTLPNMRYGVNYNLGDRVTVVIDGAALSGTIREVNISVTPEREKVIPCLATPKLKIGMLAGLQKKVNRLDTRLNNLEVI